MGKTSLIRSETFDVGSRHSGGKDDSSIKKSKKSRERLETGHAEGIGELRVRRPNRLPGSTGIRTCGLPAAKSRQTSEGSPSSRICSLPTRTRCVPVDLSSPALGEVG